MPSAVIHHTSILSINGDILRIRLPADTSGGDMAPRFGDLAEVRDVDGRERLAQVVKLDLQEASLQVFSGSKGISTRATVRFLGHPPDVAFSANILGRKEAEGHTSCHYHSKCVSRQARRTTEKPALTPFTKKAQNLQPPR
jgi:vacuolar-type H+-ATPase subunit B/Vma2